MNKMPWLFVVASFLISLTAAGFPIKDDGLGQHSITPGDVERALSDLSFTNDYDFEGIVSSWSCSASLVRYEQSRDDDRAMILTNGHCLGRFPAPNTFIANRSDQRSFNLLDRSGNRLARLRTTKIIYATMTGTDMALFELRDSFEQIQSRHGIRPLTLSSRKATVGDSIEIISGYWRRGYSCQIEKFIHELKEDNWTMVDSIRYSRPGCDIVGGTSGSPIILAGTRTVVGVNNTANESGRQCTMNNPCEVEENGQRQAHRGYGYGQQTYWIYSCLDDQLQLNLEREGCQLFH